MPLTKVEFTVEVPKGSDVAGQVKQSLQDVSGAVDFDSKSGRLIVESQTPWPSLLARIESSGLRAALTGFGGKAAVSIIDKGCQESVKGVVRFTGPDAESTELVVDGVIDGLDPGKIFQLQIHECGDLSKGCDSVGDLYGRRPLGSTQATAEGRISFRFIDDQHSISDITGRSVVVASENKQRFACGIIARAAGINENFKKICACDGITLWDERNVPAAGGSRTSYAKK